MKLSRSVGHTMEEAYSPLTCKIFSVDSFFKFFQTPENMENLFCETIGALMKNFQVVIVFYSFSLSLVEASKHTFLG